LYWKIFGVRVPTVVILKIKVYRLSQYFETPIPNVLK